MSFDINKILEEMIAAAREAVESDIDKIPANFAEIFNNEAQAFAALSAARIGKEISEEVFKKEIEREKKVIEAELLTVQIISKSLAQKAVNAAIGVLENAIKLAL